jgi:hypothetical protein
MSQYAEMFWELFESSGLIVYYLWYKLFMYQ